jgi:hypothetical protein
MLPMLEAEAAERRKATQFGNNGGGNNSTTDTGKSRDIAAARLGVNPRYISDAKAIKKDAPAMRQLLHFHLIAHALRSRLLRPSWSTRPVPPPALRRATGQMRRSVLALHLVS